MWVIRWFFLAFFILIAIAFAAYNNDSTVVIKFFKWQSIALPLWVVMYLCFAAGIVTWLIISIAQIFSLKNSLRKYRKELKKVNEELSRMRNVNLTEEVPETPQLTLDH